jgi:hypothetical protein
MNATKVMLFVLLCLSFVLQGCVLLAVGAGAAAGAGTAAYLKGELQTPYAASLDQTWEAVQDALKDLNYRIVSSRKDDPEGELEAKRIGEDTVKIHVMISGQGTTLVKIRVGVFGNETESRAINSKIASRLGVTL